MINAIHQPQTILVLGGTSDIARAIVRELESPALQQVILACRRPSEADLGGFGDHSSVVAVEFDATDFENHTQFIDGVASKYGDLDIVIQAFGQLGTEARDDPASAARLASVNYGGAVSSGLAVAECLKKQGHGTLIVLSSVAGIRTRPSNFIYGSSKAGQDAFATGLGHALHGTGVNVMTVRPGFVRSSMTTGLDEAPFSVDPEDVAVAVAKGLQRGSDVVWVPGLLRMVFGLLRYAPGFVWRKLDS
ncbi:MAG: SDR family NAD(P)-dependent oxidoreductase [Actinobacteria bacterium]|nr:SDR family NAD(P)-dependent oxidoreductase [Actinomycetota bacterium]